MADSARIPFPSSVAVTDLSLINAGVVVPWYVWSSVLAVTSTTVGLYWDISWHIGIGRDTFWTPAHFGHSVRCSDHRTFLRLSDSAHHVCR